MISINDPSTILTDDYFRFATQRIDALFNRTSEFPLTIVEALPGFGKSIQSLRWAWRCKERGETVLMLDAVCPEQVSTFLGQSQVLLSGKTSRIIIDNAHLMSRSETALIKDRIARPNLSLHFVLVGHAGKMDPFSSARIKEQAFSITSRDLALTPEECCRFIGCKLNEIEDFYRHTQGWPSAVGSAEKHLRVEVAPEFWDFLKSEILAHLDDTSLMHMIGLSVLGTLPGPRARRALNMPNGLYDSLKLRYRHLFANGSTDLGLHPSISKGLNLLGWEGCPDEMRRLHRLASDIHRAEGETTSSLSHAANIGRPDHVAELIEEAGGLVIWLNEGREKMEAVMSFADHAIYTDYPRLQLVRAIFHVKEGKLDQAVSAWEEARSISQGFEKDRPGGNDTALKEESRILEFLFAAYGCRRLEDQVATSQSLLVETPSADHGDMFAGVVYTLMCLNSLQNGNFGDAMRQADLSEKAFEKAGSDYGILFLDFHRAGVALGQAEFEKAEWYLKRAMRRQRRHFPSDDGLRSICQIFYAEIDLERGRLKTARRRLKNVSRHLRAGEAWFDIYASAIRSESYLDYLLNGMDAADEGLQTSRMIGAERGLTRVERLVDTVRLELACLAGRRGKSNEMAERLSLSEVFDDPDRMKFVMWREYLQQAIAQIVHYRSIGSFEEADKLALDLNAFSETSGNVLCEVYSLGFLAIGSASHRNMFIKRMNETQCLLPIMLYSEIRHAIAQDAGSLGASLLAEAEDILTRLRPKPKSALTPRETSVAKALSEGLSDKVIAQRLGISVHGVRYHIKNIFKKTGVNNRSDAVEALSERQA